MANRFENPSNHPIERQAGDKNTESSALQKQASNLLSDRGNSPQSSNESRAQESQDMVNKGQLPDFNIDFKSEGGPKNIDGDGPKGEQGKDTKSSDGADGTPQNLNNQNNNDASSNDAKPEPTGAGAGAAPDSTPRNDTKSPEVQG